MGLDGMGWDWLSLNRLAIRSPQSGAKKTHKPKSTIMEPAVVGSLVELRGFSDLKSRVYFGEEKARGTYDSSVSDLES